jgi:exopolysaccharide biosynthesis polyprenyl glycosylphosphotransferase
MSDTAHTYDTPVRPLEADAAHVPLRVRAPDAGRRDYVLRRLLVGGDLLVIVSAIIAANSLSPGQPASAIGWGALSLPFWVLLFHVYGLYDRDGRRISHSTVDDVPRLFHALVVGSLGMWFFYKLGPEHSLILSASIGFAAAAFVGVLVVRSAIRSLVRASTRPERTLFVGDGPVADVLARKLTAHPEYCVEPVGCLRTRDAEGRPKPCALEPLGTVEELEEVCARERIERLILLPTEDDDTLIDLIRHARGMQIRMSIVPSAMEVLGPAVEVDDVEGITVLGVNPPVLTRSSRTLKRTMDLAVAGTALVLAAPALAVIAVVVRMTSPGPALFFQDRVGQDGRHFRLLKFRTMHLDAEARTEELRALSRDPHWLHVENDPRITRAGRFLRQTSLDELPQLWNVIRGDMSLVGPRPLTPGDHANVVAGWGWRRLDLTPGITGLWQVLGRTRIPFEEMVKLDYLYVTNWSLWGDVRLLIRTLPVVLRRHGAN